MICTGCPSFGLRVEERGGVLASENPEFPKAFRRCREVHLRKLMKQKPPEHLPQAWPLVWPLHEATHKSHKTFPNGLGLEVQCQGHSLQGHDAWIKETKGGGGKAEASKQDPQILQRERERSHQRGDNDNNGPPPSPRSPHPPPPSAGEPPDRALPSQLRS